MMHAMNWPEEGTMRVLTEDERVWLVEHGCDPHCHACGEAIAVGKLWGLKTSPIGLDPVLNIRIRGMICAPCVEAGREISGEDVVQRFTAHFDGQKLVADIDADGNVEHHPTPPPPRHGCFVLDDGSSF